ncbi:MAG: nucleotidyltransferase domain-containing protein [Candidatus Binataceae bacterium]
MAIEVQTQVLDADPALREIVRRIAGAYQPLQIYLFGSMACGTAGPDSDYDLLVVVPDDAPPEQRKSKLAHQRLWGIDKAKDVLVCTEGWFRSRVNLVSSLAGTVVREGKLLYAA